MSGRKIEETRVDETLDLINLSYFSARHFSGYAFWTRPAVIAIDRSSTACYRETLKLLNDMRSANDNFLASPSRLYRGIAIFFLLFTAFDLSLPSLCEEDAPNVSIVAQTPQPASMLAEPSSSRSSHQSGTDREEHDCFCCCTHVTPGERVRVADSSFSTGTDLWEIGNLPVAPPDRTDHPPRIT